MSSAACTARYGGTGARCERPSGHPGMHWADQKALRWGGRYAPADLRGKPGAVRDADRDQAARRRRPRGPHCEVCCAPVGELVNGRCRDQAACAERQPPLFAISELPEA